MSRGNAPRPAAQPASDGEPIKNAVAEMRQATPDEDIAGLAHRLIELFYSSPDCTTAGIAEALGVSSAQLCHRYRERWDTTILADIRKRRIALACGLLETSDASCKTVAAQSGYLHHSYRAVLNAFRSEVGSTPDLYRASHGEVRLHENRRRLRDWRARKRTAEAS